jgi:hypothetical protein
MPQRFLLLLPAVPALCVLAILEQAVAAQTPAAAPAPPTVSPAQLTRAEQDALAERYRTNFLQELSPDDWYKCYVDANLTGIQSPMIDALRKARISEAQIKPLIQKEVFARFTWILWVRALGEELPKEAYVNCNSAKPQPDPRSAGRTLLRGLTRFLGSVLQGLAPSEVAFVARRVAGDGDGEPATPAKTDEQIETTAREGLLTAKSIVATYLGQDEAATFEDSPARVKARKVALAAEAVIVRREWPNAFFLTLASIGGGASGWSLQQYYDDSNHPDVKGWSEASDYERGESLRRMYAAKMRVLADVAAGKVRLEDAVAEKQGFRSFDARRFIGESFGVAARQQYLDDERSTAPGTRSEDLRIAAYVYSQALWLIVGVSMSLPRRASRLRQVSRAGSANEYALTHTQWQAKLRHSLAMVHTRPSVALRSLEHLLHRLEIEGKKSVGDWHIEQTLEAVSIVQSHLEDHRQSAETILRLAKHHEQQITYYTRAFVSASATAALEFAAAGDRARAASVLERAAPAAATLRPHEKEFRRANRVVKVKQQSARRSKRRRSG